MEKTVRDLESQVQTQQKQLSRYETRLKGIRRQLTTQSTQLSLSLCFSRCGRGLQGAPEGERGAGSKFIGSLFKKLQRGVALHVHAERRRQRNCVGRETKSCRKQRRCAFRIGVRAANANRDFDELPRNSIGGEIEDGGFVPGGQKGDAQRVEDKR